MDEPFEPLDAFRALYGAAEDSQGIRRQILRESIRVAEAAELTGRSRQALERQRRQGRLLALRRSNQWLYPRWQFDADAPGGVVSGLAEVLPLLGLSPTGAAFWLSQPRPELDGRAPVELLHQRRTDPVLALAKEQGLMI
ncbi:MAG: helix-turn-helix domain-containing protein [Thermoanaerobaculia bacterium]